VLFKVSVDSDSIVLDSTRLAGTADSSADDEEQEWLNALESGDLDDNGELKRERDLSILTVRQVNTSNKWNIIDQNHIYKLATPISDTMCSRD